MSFDNRVGFAQHVEIEVFCASQIIETLQRFAECRIERMWAERRGVMREQSRSSFAVVTFYTTSALVTALGLAILITSATIAYMVAQSFK